jgi:hypothetical protein
VSACSVPATLVSASRRRPRPAWRFQPPAASFTTSGIASIESGNTSKDVTPGVPISDFTRILVTLHGDPGDGTVLKRVSKNTSDGTFKVRLTAPSTNACAFSWFLIG